MPFHTELVDVLSPNAADTNTYTEICRRLDIDSYTNYMALLLYLDNWDWPQNNVKGFRHRQDGPFRFVVFDLDHAFSGGDPFNTFWSKEEFTFDQLYPSTLSRIRQRIRFVTLFKNMLKNSNFRRKFIDAFCIIGGSVLEKRRSAEIIDKLLERVEPAMKLETIWTDRGEVRNSANETASDVKYHLEHQLDNAIKWLRNEPRLQLTTTAQRVTLASDCDGATLFINDQKVPTGKLDGYLYAPVTLRTQAPAGYTFKGWVNGAGRTVSKEPENATSIFSTLSDDSEFSMCYGSGTLFIQGAAQGNIILYIYASDGRAVVETKADMGHGSAKYDVSTLAPGLYIAIATNESGRQASCKFVR